MSFKIYAGLSGGFGGAYYCHTSNTNDRATAEQEAYQEACDIFDSQMGIGIESMEDLENQAKDELDREDYENDEDYQTAVSEYVDEAYNDLRESWIDYHVIEGDEEDESFDESYNDDF